MNNINSQLESLVFDPKNARVHDARNMKAIESSYKEFGQQKPIVVSEDNVVLAGNGQLQAAKNLGWDSIAVIKYDGNDESMGAYALADNRTGELAYWDMDNLKDILDVLPQNMMDVLEFNEFVFPDLDMFDTDSEELRKSRRDLENSLWEDNGGEAVKDYTAGVGSYTISFRNQDDEIEFCKRIGIEPTHQVGTAQRWPIRQDREEVEA